LVLHVSGVRHVDTYRQDGYDSKIINGLFHT
jgi:hypothetical protein